jgi:hypothetical protein
VYEVGAHDFVDNRRRHRMRRNRRRHYRRNPEIMAWLKTGAFIAGGIMAHKLVTGLINTALTGGGAAATPAAAPAPTSGILPDSMAPYSSFIAGGIAAAGGVFAASKLIKDKETRVLVAGGIVASLVHTVIIAALNKSPTTAKFAAQMSGLGSDGTAARLSAMFGFNGTSIMPMHALAPMRGFGEYFDSGVSGLGSHPMEASAGMGEYFDSGVSGLGEYGANPDIYQAAAGYGAVETSNTNHLDPGSNLDRALSIAEAAAGVGVTPTMQAAAGFGEYFDSGVSGLGSTVGTSQTWIPGQSQPSIWAGVRPTDRSQAETAQIPAGVLESGGGQGVFG